MAIFLAKFMRVFCIGLGLVWTNEFALAAQDLTQLPTLRIVWDTKNSVKRSRDHNEATWGEVWNNSCKTLGERFLVGKGVYGTGAFSSYSCHEGVSVVGDQEKNVWQLTYIEADDQIRLAVTDPAQKVMSELAIERSTHSVYFFSDSDFSDIVALYLMDGLPFIGRIESNSLSPEARLQVRRGRSKYGVIPVPRFFVTYALSYDDRTDVFSAALKGRLLNQTKRLSAGTDVGAKSQERSLIFQADTSLKKSLAAAPFWFHTDKGRGKMAKRLMTVLLRANERLISMVQEGSIKEYVSGTYQPKNTIGGYVALRYGKQLLNGDDLVEKMSMIGVVAEVRGGVLNGMRLYYDTQPKVELVQNGYDTSVQWSRFIVGKSFGLNLNRFVDRIEVTPKVGVWSFNANLPTTTDGGGNVTSVGSFDMQRAISMSLEVGAEWSSRRYSLRPWYSFDGALMNSGLGTKQVTSSRVGLDFVWSFSTGIRVAHTRLHPAVLAFGMYESISITDSDDPDVSEGDQKIIGVNYSGGYAGFGLGVAW